MTTNTNDIPEGTTEFAAHLVAHEHPAQRGRFPEWIELARKVEAVHADDPTAPHGLAASLAGLSALLETHMLAEDTVLFPALRLAARHGDGAGLRPLLDAARAEHAVCAEAAAQAVATLGALPPGACRSWRRLHAGVTDLLDDLQVLIRVEDDVLLAGTATGRSER